MIRETQERYLIDGLYEKLIEGGLSYFFPSARIDSLGRGPSRNQEPITLEPDRLSVTINWLGVRCLLTREERFSDAEMRLLRGIGAVLGARYRMITDVDRVEQRFELFRGLPEDRYVSAYIDQAAYDDPAWKGPDRLVDAIEVLRTTSLSTYENRRISTGALLFGRMPDPCHQLPAKPAGALRYSPGLTSIRTFYRLCDGLQTMALLDQEGFLAEIVDVEEWAQSYGDIPLPVPSPARYRTHSRATLCGGHVCMILTPNGEMKIIADGVEIFRFWGGRWRLTDAERKYGLWNDAIGKFTIGGTPLRCCTQSRRRAEGRTAGRSG